MDSSETMIQKLTEITCILKQSELELDSIIQNPDFLDFKDEVRKLELTVNRSTRCSKQLLLSIAKISPVLKNGFIEHFIGFHKLNKQYWKMTSDVKHRQLQIVDTKADDTSRHQLATSTVFVPDYTAIAEYDISKQREQDVIELARSINEMKELFDLISLLVLEQGDKLNDTEEYVDTAMNNTKKGIDQLQKASKTQKKTRSKTCWIAGIGLVLLGGGVASAGLSGI